MPFSGFPNETISFLSDLRSNNSKAWFDANRQRYEDQYKTPALDLVAALAGPLQQLDPPLVAEPRVDGSLRRINRDVRFSNDKTPYSPRIHLVFWAGNRNGRWQGMHFVVHPDSLGYGVGVYGPDPAVLAAYRGRICDPADRAALLKAEKAARAIGCKWDPPELKRLPRGFEADGDWEHLLRRKSLIMRTLEDRPLPGWLQTADCVDEMVRLTGACLPLIRWLSL